VRFSWIQRVALSLFLVAAPALAAGGCGSLPAKVTEVLGHADQFEILAIEPYGGPPNTAAGQTVFHSYPVLGRAVVTDPAVRERIVSIIDGGVSTTATQSKCFNPRHAVHAVRGGQTVDMLICYECSSIEVYDGGDATILATNNVQAELDKEFAALGVKVAE
jgi:hypothetical protein